MESIYTYEDWDISYSTHGKFEEEALMFVHGASSDQRIWNQLIEEAQESRFLVTLDLLGHGKSEKPETEYNIEVWASNLKHLVDHLKLKKVILVAHSFGVLIAKQFYSVFPELTHALIIVDGSLKQVLSEPIYQWMKTTLDRPDYEDYMKSLNEKSTNFCLKKKDSDMINEGVLNTPKYVLRGQLESMRAQEEVDMSIDLPVLAFHANSHEWNAESEAYLRKHVKQLDLHVWDDVSHFMMMEKPKEMWNIINGFLTTHF